MCDLDAPCGFHTQVLGMREWISDGGGRALAFGGQEIGLCLHSQETELSSLRPTLGATDLHFTKSHYHAWPTICAATESP